MLTDAITRDLTISDGHSNGYCDGNSDFNRNGDSHSHSYCYGYRDSNCHSHGDSHGNGYAYADAHLNSTTYPKAKVQPATGNSANSAATPVARNDRLVARPSP